MTVYSFRDQLVMSDGVAATAAVHEILLDAIPGATGVRRATEQADKSGTDWWVDRINGAPLSIDLKARKEDWVRYLHDDLALEVWSVVESRKQGWTLDATKRTDYILWLWKDTGRWCLVPFPMLCTVFRERFGEWLEAYGTARQNTEGRYHSECVFVPRIVVWRAIYERFGGTPERKVA